ncbi:MAG: helix-turn-helix transcriptional regulator, partial [Sedimentibacter sp.]
SVLLSQEWLRLEVLCEEFMDNLNCFHNQLGILYCLLYKSVAKFKLFGTDKGIEVLVRALEIARKDNIILPFAENADYILPILNDFNRNEIDINWLEFVKKSCKAYSKNLKKYYTKTKPFFTNRERQVLELLEQGLTQKEISRELFISVSSVKRYLESLYRKLNASNKTMAINNAKKINY